MKRYLSLILSLMLCEGFAEQLPEWNEGVVVLNDKTVCTGQLIVQLEYDLVLIKQHDRVDVLPAHKVETVRFYDEKNNINRHYISISYKEHGIRSHQLYEVVLQGEVNVVRHIKGENTVKQPGVNDFNYFFVYDTKMVPLRQFRGKVYPWLLDRNKETVLSFIKSEKLNPNKPGDAISLIRFYNNLFSVTNSSLTRS